MVSISANLFKLHIVSLSDFLCYVNNGERDVISEQRLTIFDGKDNVVVRVIHVMGGPAESHALILCENRGFHTFLQGVAAEPRGKRGNKTKYQRD